MEGDCALAEVERGEEEGAVPFSNYQNRVPRAVVPSWDGGGLCPGPIPGGMRGPIIMGGGGGPCKGCPEFGGGGVVGVVG